MDRRRLLGIGLVVVAGASFGSGSIFATLSYEAGLDWLAVMWWRFLIGATLIWLWVGTSPSRRAAARRMPRRKVAVALALGALYSGNAGAYYAAIETVPAALAGSSSTSTRSSWPSCPCASRRDSPGVGLGSPWASRWPGSSWRWAGST